MSSLIPLLVLGAVAYYYLVMRKGSGGGIDYGLRPGEGVSAMYAGSLFQKPGATGWFQPLEDEQVAITWTTTDRLVVSSPRGAFTPVALDGAPRPQAAIVGKVTEQGVALFGKDPQAQLAGPNGLEPAVVVEIKDGTHAPAQLIVAKSGAERLVAWSRGG
jgi:hypothetical protein